MTDEEKHYVALLEQTIIGERFVRWLLFIAFVSLFVLAALAYLKFLNPVSGDNWTPQELSQCLNMCRRSFRS